jgi:hypothetical protein
MYESKYIDIAYDNYGYMPGDFVMWNDMSIKRKNSNRNDVGVYIGSVRPGEFEILIGEDTMVVHWNEVKPLGFETSRKRSRRHA